VPIAAIADINS